MSDQKMQKRGSSKDEIISLLDEKIKSDLKTQCTFITPKNEDSIEQAVLKGMKEKLAGFSKDNNNPLLDFILLQIKDAEHQKIAYQTCIDQICLNIFRTLNSV